MFHANARVFLASCLSLSVVAVPALAQAPAPAGAISTLEEVVVTAQKRSENLQEIPKQVQVVSNEQLRNSNVSSVIDLVKLVPSMTGPNNTGMGGNTSMRGVGTAANSLGANSKVGIVLDDVPMPSRSTSMQNLLDIGQVEILPGPQGTLAGRNALGGLINLVTRRPSRDTFSGNIETTATGDHEYRGGVYLSGPISDRLSYSLSGNYQNLRGLAYNAALNKWDLATDNYGIRAKMVWALDEDTDLSLTYSHFREHNEGGGVGGWANVLSKIDIPLNTLTSTYECLALLANGNCNAAAPGKKTFTQLLPGVTPGPDNVSYYSLNNQRQTRKSNMGVVRLEHNFETGTFTAVGSMFKELFPQLQNWFAYPTVNMDIRPDFDGYAHVYNGSVSNTMEARFASDNSKNWTYLVGGFWQDGKNLYNYERVIQTFMANREFGFGSEALFGSTSYKFATGTTLRVGARYESDDINYLWRFRDLPALSRTLANGIVRTYPAYTRQTTSGKTSDSFVNYDFGLQQKLGGASMAYVSYAHAYQGPLYDSENTVDAEANKELVPLPPEEVNSIELGFKSQWFDNRLTFNINAFSMKFKNYQATTNVLDTTNPLATPQIKLWAAGAVSSKGIEVTSSALLGERFRMDLAAMLNKAVIDDWKNAPCYNLQTAAQGCVTAIPAGESVSRAHQPSIAGNWLADAPRLKLTAVGTYTNFIGAMKYAASLTVRHNSETHGDQLGSPIANLPSRTFLDANVTFSINKFDISLIGVNLTEDFAETYGTGLGYGLIAPTGVNTGVRADGSFPVTTRNLNRDNVRYIAARLKYSF